MINTDGSYGSRHKEIQPGLPSNHGGGSAHFEGDRAMATTEFDISQLRSPLRERIVVAVTAAYARIAGIWHAMRNRRAVASLLDWDAHMLKDIGLTAGDVRSAMSSPLSEDPSFRLSVLSVERRAGLRATARERLDLVRGGKVISLTALRRSGERCLEI
jgi:uncharacterized protein YjiS (DUF1127 family)